MIIKKFIFLILILNFFSFSYAEEKVAYIDMDLILSKSNASISLFNQLKKIETTQLENLNKKEKILKDNENKILSSKNILSNEEYVKKVKIFNKDLTNYQSKKKEIIRSFNSKQNNEIMRFIKLISPLINEYMDKNSISILIEKKNIFIAKSNYDITKNILEIINNEVKEFKILND
jgi:outer membrane protein